MIVFVFDAPGPDGLPLSPEDWSVFKLMLRAANLDMDKVRLATILRVHADPKALDKAIKEPGLLDAAREDLARLVTSVGANIVVPMGRLATLAFVGEKKLMAYRGAVTDADYVLPGLKVLATFPPATVKVSWKLLPVAVGDIVKAIAESEFPEVRRLNRNLYVEPSLAEVKEWCERCNASKEVAADIETGWGQITCISLAPDPQNSLCIPFVDLRKPNKSYWKTEDAEIEAWQAVRSVLTNPAVAKIGQNFMYDAFWLWQKLRIPVINYSQDTRLLHHSLYPELPKSLEFMGATYTDIGPWKIWSVRGEQKRDE